MRILLVLALVMMAGVPVSAQSPTDPSACVAISGDAERLACYDAIFRPSAGEVTGALVIESNQPIPARPTGRGPATMTIACTGEGLAVSFAFAGQLLSETGDDAALSYQLQQTGNVVRNLPVSADNMSIGFPPGAATETFLESIEGGRNIQVRVTPIRQRSLQVVFNLATHAVEIDALRETCR